MPDPTDSTTEAQPLNEEEGGAQGLPHPSGKEDGCRKEDGWWGRLGLSHLSNWRTACFFLSLFLCLIVVFAFSFIIPCPVRPVYLHMWNHTLPQAATYDFLAVKDANKDKVLDVLFVIKAPEGSLNITCVNQSLPTPCVFMSAVAGTNGEPLWERPLAPELHWVQCGLSLGLGEEGKGCLLSHSNQLTAVSHHSGEIFWQRAHPPTYSSQLPVLTVPDLDKDGVDDLVLIGPGPAQAVLTILSGKTGDGIGKEVGLESEVLTHLLHTTAKGSPYILLHKDSGLYGVALQKIAAQAKPGCEKNLKKDEEWEKKTSSDTGQVLLYKSDSVQYVLSIAQKRKTSNLLVVTEDSVEVLNGDSLKSLWRTNASRLLSEPSLGHFNKDGIPDVVIEENIGDGTKQVVILDGSTGGVLWEVNMLLRPNSPQPSAVNTLNSYSIFVLWGEMPSQTNSSSPASKGHFSYMLNPEFSNVLLEKSNSIDQIIAFKATLLERGRHACYITLTGPADQERLGTVMISKRKLKEEVPESRVLRLGVSPEGESDDEIRAAYNKLRFSKDV
ncbi:protein FAM234A [Conger conger]|uniref:protein FAM234A n=1 Tax=Conger conger TaxID=82655 RepID=UPI002A5A335B|nr:protein FAM234A [Conger conger]